MLEYWIILQILKRAKSEACSSYFMTVEGNVVDPCQVFDNRMIEELIKKQSENDFTYRLVRIKENYYLDWMIALMKDS